MDKQGEFTKLVVFTNLGRFCKFPLFFQEKHAEFRKTLRFREPAREAAFFLFGLPGRLLKIRIFHSHTMPKDEL